MSMSVANTTSAASAGEVDGIPVRNLWLLMLYASQLFRQVRQAGNVDVENNPEDLPDLVAEILTHAVPVSYTHLTLPTN